MVPAYDRPEISGFSTFRSRRPPFVKRSSKPPCSGHEFTRHPASKYLIKRPFWLRVSPRKNFHPDSPRIAGEIRGSAGGIFALLACRGERVRPAGRALRILADADRVEARAQRVIDQ